MPPKIPKTAEEHLALIHGVLAGKATPEEIALAKNLKAIRDGVVDADTILASEKPIVSPAILRGAEANERRQKGILGDDY